MTPDLLASADIAADLDEMLARVERKRVRREKWRKRVGPPGVEIVWCWHCDEVPVRPPEALCGDCLKKWERDEEENEETP